MKLVASERSHPIHGFYTAYILVLDSGRQVLISEDYTHSGPPECVKLSLLDDKRFLV